MKVDTPTTIEDCLEILVGLQDYDAEFKVEKADKHILESIGRQVFKGIALTDRQLDLVKTKFLFYKKQFDEASINIIELDTLRQPLRQIDRSKYIRLVDYPHNHVYEATNNKWIEIRFPFSKKMILVLSDIPKRSGEYIHEQGTHSHYFIYNEFYVDQIVTAFEGKNFDIDKEILDLYEEIKIMKNNPQDYLPGVYGLKLKNLNDKAVEYLITDIGEPTKDNLYLYRDRKNIFGLSHFDEDDLDESVRQLTPLSKKLLYRKTNRVLVNKNEYNLDRLLETLLELHRYPCLFILNEYQCHYVLPELHNRLKNIFYSNTMTCLFRLENKDSKNKDFNEYIKENNLNSPLDKSSKIVYISNTELKKTMFKVEWQPKTVVLFDSKRYDTKVSTYLTEQDLVIDYDEDSSLFSKVEKI